VLLFWFRAFLLYRYYRTPVQAVKELPDMQTTSCLPAIIDGLKTLAASLHQEFEQAYADADALNARAEEQWEQGNRAEYSRLMREHARLLTRLDDLDALYWATNRAAADLQDRLESREPE
jgi:hypothetical protein